MHRTLKAKKSRSKLKIKISKNDENVTQNDELYLVLLIIRLPRKVVYQTFLLLR